MNKICVLIRVYNRIEDLVHCIDIIRDTWHNHAYHILVVFNGEGDGFSIPETSKAKIDNLVTIPNNTGHFSGNSTLLLEGLKHIPEECEYTVILEADTWIYGDNLLTKYIPKMKEQGAVWASAQFFRYVRNLATDFAIVNTAFVKQYPAVFTFQLTPEYYVANYLHKLGKRFTYIKELMPINLPRYVKKYPFAPTGRFFSFVQGKMVTHHIETLKGGMNEKKHHFNTVAGTEYFRLPGRTMPGLTRLAMRAAVSLSYLFPYKGWFVKEKDV